MALAAVCALNLAVVAIVVTSGPAIASVGSDRAQAAQLQQQIAAEGARAETLVERSNAVQAQVDALNVQIAHSQLRVASDKKTEAVGLAEAKNVAVAAYMNSAGGSSTLQVFTDSQSVTTAVVHNSYLSAANNKLNADLNTLVQDVARTHAAQSKLRSQQARATATLRQLASARTAATSAITADEATLRHVNGNLRSLLGAEAKQRAAAEAAAERRLAQAPVDNPPSAPSSPSSPNPLPPPPPVHPSPGGYANPLRGLSALSPERIDQGVDYSGFGPIYAIGNGVVVSTVNGGWPGGTFIAYRLTDGPAAGLTVFAAEDIQPTVQVGQTVTPNTVLGQVYEGPTGIETGWADGSGNGDTMARTYGQFQGSNSTAFGYNFSRLLQSVGAPGGVLATNPPTGTLPNGWPQW